MKKFLFLLVSFFFINSVYANNLNFVQVSDVHYAKYRNNPYKYRMIEDIDKLLDNTVQQINGINSLDFVFFTGDQIDFSKDFNLKGFIEHTNKLKYPWYFCFGNHDVYKYGTLTRKEYLKQVKQNSEDCKTSKIIIVFRRKMVIKQ